MDDFNELLKQTLKVSQESQEQTKPDANPKGNETQPKNQTAEPIQKPNKPNIKKDVFILNTKNIKAEKRKLQQ